MANKKSNGKPAPGPSKKPQAPAQAAPVPQQQGLKAMSQDDVNAYMEQVLTGKRQGLAGLELNILNRFKGNSQQQGEVERRLNKAKKSVEELQTLISQLQGEAQGYINLLVSAEDERRNNSTRKKPKRQPEARAEA